MTVGSNTQYLAPMGLSQPGSPVQGGGGSALAISFRDPIDAARSMQGVRAPQAEYPDGYLGTINSRREDRMLNSLKKNLNQRAYQRGVHKGERIDPGDYFWPDEYSNDAGLMRQMAAVADVSTGGRVFMTERAAPHGTLSERLTVLGERMPRGSELLELDPRAVSNLDRLRPAWS